MADFWNILYLKDGNTRQRRAYRVLTELDIFNQLIEFEPFLAGTVPIGIDVEGSDLDILCCFSSRKDFMRKVSATFGSMSHFRLREKDNPEVVIVNFTTEAFDIEIFAQSIPVREQYGYRHMLVEQKILESYGPDFQKKIIALKKTGVKTEPAFAQLLGLAGDPYKALLEFNHIQELPLIQIKRHE
jgi:hypothetical protein